MYKNKNSNCKSECGEAYWKIMAPKKNFGGIFTIFKQNELGKYLIPSKITNYNLW